MNIRPIRNEEDYVAAMARIDELLGAESGTAEGDELGVLALVVENTRMSIIQCPPRTPSRRSSFAWISRG